MGSRPSSFVLCLLLFGAALEAAVPARADTRAPAAPARVHELHLGVSDDARLLWPNDVKRSDAAWLRLQELGARWLRVYVSDDPAAVRRRMAGWDQQIHGAKLAGLRVIVTIGSQRRRSERLPKIVRRLAKRWRGGVAAWSVINEPQLTGWRQAPCTYRRLWERSRRALLRIDPEATVLFGELAPQGGLEYLTRIMMCERGAPLEVDGVSVHPYQFQSPPSVPDAQVIKPFGTLLGIGRITDLNALLRAPESTIRTPEGGPPTVWITEFGYLTKGAFGIPEGRAAGWWAGAMRVACRQGVDVLVAHAISEETRFGHDHQGWDSSLFRGDGQPRAAAATVADSSRSCTSAPGEGSTLDVAALFADQVAARSAALRGRYRDANPNRSSSAGE